MTEHDIRALFREMRDEPVPADSLARMRAGVERRLNKRHWKIAAAALLASACGAGWLMFRPAVPAATEPLQMITRAELAPAVPPESRVQPVPPPRRARPRAVKTVPVMIRIETPDPDIVILFVN